jgi:hypothetical protein
LVLFCTRELQFRGWRNSCCPFLLLRERESRSIERSWFSSNYRVNRRSLPNGRQRVGRQGTEWCGVSCCLLLVR